MRTSHLEMRRRIDNEKLKITDEQLFATNSFSGYLTDLAETASKRYRRSIFVNTYWDDSENANIAHTDNRKIVINVGNFITRSLPSRKLKADSLVGICAHEIGHILYSDFGALSLYLNYMEGGKFFPYDPMDLSTTEEINLLEIKEVFADESKVGRKVIMQIAANLTNLLEDIYIEARMCNTFPGVLKSGILLVGIRIIENFPSIQVQIDSGKKPISIIFNLFLQYCRSGDINNLENYKGEYLDVLYDCLPLIDDAVYDDDVKVRFSAANKLIVKLWKYIKDMIKEVEEDAKNGKGTEDKLLDELLNSLESEKIKCGSDPSGSGKPVKSTGKFIHNTDSEDEAKEEIQKVIDYETSRIKLEKTDDISDGDSGGVSYLDYTGAGYTSCEDYINRILCNAAEESVSIEIETELTKEIEIEANKIRHGNAHKGIHINVNRMSYVPLEILESYKRIAPPLLLISKRMQKQVMQVLKDKKEGSKLTGLLMGKRLNSRSLVNGDGRIFYNNRLPSDNSKLAVALLIDESGSMSSNDRITVARAASIVIYDFCDSLSIPVVVYGHTEQSNVDIYSYAEFDSIDKKDRYRIMDMCARSGNRDGAALRFTCERLLTRNEDTKLLILISDGQPAGRGYGGTEAEADLRGIKREYTNKGIIMFAAAIGDDKPDIERIYGDGFLDITDLKKLPINLTNLISKYIKK